MRILIINSRFFISAGPEKYMFSLIEILKKKNHDVIVFSTKNVKNKKNDYENYFVSSIGGEDKVYFEEYKKTPSIIFKIFERQFYSFEVKNALKRLIKDTNPDIAYILHHQNKLSPSVIDACKEHNLPVFLRISDFSLACPSNNFLRSSEICELCTKSLFNSIKYKCVKKSFFGSLIKATALKYYRLTKIYEKADAIIFPSQFTMNKLKFLFKKPKLIYIPTFILAQDLSNINKTKNKINKELPNGEANDDNYALFVGRIEEEKGIIYAIKAFDELSKLENKKRVKYKLKIVGKSHTGYIKELLKYVEKNNIKNIEFLGEKTQEELKELYENSKFFIMPNIWYENMPNTILEAFSFGKPVIASNIGSISELIIDKYNGFLVSPKNVTEIMKKSKLLFEDKNLRMKLGKNAYNDSIKKYNPENHYEKLLNLFNEIRK